MFKKVAVAAVLWASSGAVLASNSVDARFASSSLEAKDSIDDVKIDGPGFDARASFDLTPQISLHGSYLATKADEAEVNGVDYTADTDLSIIRAGLSYLFPLNSFAVYVLADYTKAKLKIEGESEDDSGYILGAGLKDKGDGHFLWDVQLGYASLDDLGDGAVFEFNLGYRFNPNIALVLGGQGYAVSKDDVDTTIGTGSLGLKVSF